MSYAKKAVELSGHTPMKSFDDFQSAMKRANLPFTAWSSKGLGLVADLVIFTDGSGFFADQDSSYRPWPLDADPDDEDELEAEFLPIMEHPESLFKAGAVLYSVSPFDPEFCEALTEHAIKCVKEHPDPPEAMRELVWEPAHSFEWVEASGESEVQHILILCATYLYPPADEIVIKADIRPGISSAQARSDQSMIDMLSSSGIGAQYELNMSATYKGLPHAEISSDAGDYRNLEKANEPMVWLSTRLLQKVGMPLGWEVDYNDGHHTRMSGYSANSESIVIEIDGKLSNHQTLDRETTLARMLAKHDLLEGFQEILQTYDHSPLPAV